MTNSTQNVNDMVATPKPQVSSKRVNGQTVVLDLESGRYFGLDAIGSQIWAHLVEGVSLGEIVDLLAQQYGEGKKKMWEDVTKFVDELQMNGLVEIDKKAAESPSSGPVENYRPSRLRRAFQFIQAYAFLLFIDLGLRLVSLKKLCGFFSRKARSGRVVPADEVRRMTLIPLAVLRWYRPGIACLHRAVTTYCFLRWRGIPVELCLGVRTYPFASHSWVEYEGEVLDDVSAVKQWYQLLTRIN
ncbi:MAG: lasso peptide biosynthesis B2 protein [Acidobacteriota bacterium]